MFKIFSKSTKDIVKPKVKSRVTEMDKTISKRLKNKRIMLGLIQKDIATATDVTIQQVQKYENGVNRIAAGKLYEIANFLKVPIEYFFNLDDTNQETKVKNDAANTSQRQTIALVKEFIKIKNPLSRRKIIEMIKMVN
ncbi:HipB Predicted transcriptional regulators [uncultured Caudovirales phage]|uniref:HTH_XRE domain containing protein n=1 Tax=uncultured Caudovirales phage TaxID=2100421 RepID=A0A6J5TA69_9CAUD|nr:HipB Predicted transcriptional regulators [uncultured Caudovirales phage]CAB4241057.1 HTH_XRE domain containing protein [uncultured Caudovirales phage]